MSQAPEKVSDVGLGNRPPAPRLRPVTGQELAAWLDAAFDQLRSSSWGPVVVQGDLDVLEALRAEVYYRGLSLVRDGLAPHVAGSLWGGVTTQVRAGAARFREAIMERRYRRYSVEAQNGGVFFWPREPTHIKALLPVAEAIERLGRPAHFVACLPKVLRQLRGVQQEAIFLPSLWRRELAAGRALGKRQADQLRRLPPVRLDPSRLPPLANSEQLVALVRWLTVKNLPALQAAALNTRNLIDKLSADVLVVGSDVTIEGRTACQIAAAHGTPTVCTMHGLIAGSAIHAYHVADRYLVYGDRDRRELLAMGLSGDQVRVCGAPYLDNRPRQSGRIHPVIAERLGLDGERPYVLLATSGPGNTVSHGHHKRHIEAVAQASRELPGVQFVAKLHRKDRLESYAALSITAPGSRLKVVPDGVAGYPNDIFDWLQGCDLLLTAASAVSQEAMLLDVPVVTMDFAGELRKIDFIAQGATTHITDPIELVEVVRRLTGSPAAAAAARHKADGYLGDVFLAVDGRSAERVAAEIVSLIGSR